MVKNSYLDQIIRLALKEDIGSGDITSNAVVPKDSVSIAQVIFKEDGVVCGLKLLNHIYSNGAKVKLFARDGQFVRKGKVVAVVRACTRHLLACERTTLNFLQRLSGIATLTRQFVKQMRGTKAKILDTRKTTPGLRRLEKYAVKCGGGKNHRMGLYDAILIKNNHLTAIKKLELKIKSLKKRYFVEIEARSIGEAAKFAHCDFDAIMLDNFKPANMKNAVRKIRDINSKIIIETSGGVNLKMVRQIAKTGVDWISVGALTHSAKAIDISLTIK